MKIRLGKKKTEACAGFEPMTSTIPVQCSTNRADRLCWFQINLSSDKQMYCEYILSPCTGLRRKTAIAKNTYNKVRHEIPRVSHNSESASAWYRTSHVTSFEYRICMTDTKPYKIFESLHMMREWKECMT